MQKPKRMRGIKVVSSMIALHVIGISVTAHQEKNKNSDLDIKDPKVACLHRRMRSLIQNRLKEREYDYEQFASALFCSSQACHYISRSPKWLVECEDFVDFARVNYSLMCCIKEVLTDQDDDEIISMIYGNLDALSKLQLLADKLLHVLFNPTIHFGPSIDFIKQKSERDIEIARMLNTNTEQ